MFDNFIENLIQNLIQTAIIALLGVVAKKIWLLLKSMSAKSLKADSSQEITTYNVNNLKKQFYVSLAILIFSLIALATSPTFLVFPAMVALFAFILTWGAFDNLYLMAKQFQNETGKQAPNETTHPTLDI